MGRDDVESFHERLLRHFPVAAEDFRHVRLLVAQFKRPAPELICQFRANEIVQRFGLLIRIRIDENEPAPSPDFSFRQTPLRRSNVGKIPLTRHMLERAVEIPREPMEWTAELRRAEAPCLAQQTTTMKTGIVEGFEAVGPRPDDHE